MGENNKRAMTACAFGGRWEVVVVPAAARLGGTAGADCGMLREASPAGAIRAKVSSGLVLLS